MIAAIQPDYALVEMGSLPSLGAVHTWRVLRLLALRAADSATPASPYDRSGMEALEQAILSADYDTAIRYPLAVIARLLTPGVESDFERLGWACLCTAEWAFTVGSAPATARSFIYAAAAVTGLAPFIWFAEQYAHKPRLNATAEP